MTNRILPETLPALYRKHGVVPKQGGYSQIEANGTYACGLGVLCIDRNGPTDRIWGSSDAAQQIGLDSVYAYGYTAGWDNREHEQNWTTVESQASFDLGYADGAAGWEAVKDLAVTR